MPFLEAVWCFFCAVAAAVICGFGISQFLLTDRYEEYRLIVAPSIGYSVFCGLSYIISATFYLQAMTAVRITLGLLAAISLIGYWMNRQRIGLRQLARGLGEVSILSAPMLVVILWPLFYVGVTYLGAVNPDYFAAFKDNQFLKHSSVAQVGSSATLPYSPFFSGLGNISPAARFGSDLFGLMLEAVFGFAARTSLTTSIGLFLFCVPLTVYFMARVVFGAEARLGRYCAWLTGISGCTCMSFLFFYVGQNSGLSIIPLLLTIFYIVFTDPSFRVTVLAALLSNSLFFMYLGMLPYAGAPVAVLLLYMMLKRQLKWRTLLTVALTFAVCVLLLDGKLARDFVPVVTGWANVIGQTLQGQYFISFLTEEFFPIFFGFTIYPLTSSSITQALGLWSIWPFLLISGLILVWLVVIAVDWARRMEDKRPVVYVFGAAAIYIAVWWVYSFPRKYGYAVFKMSSWVQFLLVIAYGFGLYRSWVVARGIERSAWRHIATIGCICLMAIVVGGNMLTSVEYGYLGLGNTPERGIFVNNFQMSGNYDYFDLEPALKNYVKPNESVALAASDVIQNSWIGYYLRDFRISLLSHYLFPGDDENLPDVITRRTFDYYGNQNVDNNPWFHDLTDDYILTVSSQHVNADIVDQDLPKPVWSNRTFELLRTADTPDFVFTGRGYYRLETRGRERAYWMPAKWRWVSKGGEIYVLHREAGSEPYRLSFLAMVGYGAPTARRHLEIWLNNEIVDEIEVNGNRRIISRPFSLRSGVNLLVVRAKERVRSVPRRLPLWNRDVPEDYRGLNFAMSNVRVLNSSYSETASPAIMRGKAVLAEAKQFDGIELDGWVREEAKLVYLPPGGSSGVSLELLVPPEITKSGPCAIEVDADGNTSMLEANAGLQRIKVPLSSDVSSMPMEIRIKPCRTFSAPADLPALRPVQESVQIREVNFRPATLETKLQPPYTEFHAVGIDSDGWFLGHGALQIPPSAGDLQIELEFPRWSGLKRSTLDISVGGRQVVHRVVTPGIQRIRVPISSSGASDITFTSDASFRLPSPDSRSRSLRVVSLQAGL